jgi:hypothetical protein
MCGVEIKQPLDEGLLHSVARWNCIVLINLKALSGHYAVFLQVIMIFLP